MMKVLIVLAAIAALGNAQTAEVKCEEDQFECPPVETNDSDNFTFPSICIPKFLLCDNYDHCVDGSDEKGCTPDNPMCELWCPPVEDEEGNSTEGFCIKQYKACDFFPHCPDHSDETSCPPQTGDESSCDGHWCPKNDMTDLKGLIYFEGQCIPQDKVCDFEHDCPLGMDEMDCEYDSYDYDSEDGDYSF